MHQVEKRPTDESVRLQIILAGIGGQGVVLASRVLTQMALARGLPVLSTENHGMAKRGGSVVTTIKIGSFHCPMIRRGAGDVLLGLTRDEALRNLPYLKREGYCFVNSPEPDGEGLITVDATSLAEQVENPRAANLALMGFAFAHRGLGLTVDDLITAVRAIVPARTVEANLRAVQAGSEIARKRFS